MPTSVVAAIAGYGAAAGLGLTAGTFMFAAVSGAVSMFTSCALPGAFGCNKIQAKDGE